MYHVVRDVRSVINKTDNEIIDKLALNTSDSLAEYQKVDFVVVEGGDRTFHRFVPEENKGVSDLLYKCTLKIVFHYKKLAKRITPNY